MDAEREARPADALVAALAERQHGVVARSQLTALGVGRGAIDHRLRSGRLHRLHRGVFAVGHRVVSSDGVWMAAVLAAREDARLSHRSAAALWRMQNTARGRIDVTVPRHRRGTARLDLHCVALAADEVTGLRGIPVTTPARTLFDLAAVVTPDRFEHAFNEAEVRRLTSPTSLHVLLARYPGRRGTQAIRNVLEKHKKIGETFTRTDLERRFVALVDGQGLPRPRINRFTEHGELDATWPHERLIVELDGFATHGTRRAFEHDRAKDRELVTAGWRVIRVTWRQLTDDPAEIAAQLKVLLIGRAR